MQKARQSNMELLRIIAMLMIVLGHFLGQGRVRENTNGLVYAVTLVLGRGSRISVNLFIMIGCWFLCDSAFRASKVLRIWGEVVLYSTVLTVLVCIIWGIPTGPKALLNVIKPLFPILFHQLWFASAYIILMLMAPFLRCLLDLPRAAVRSLLLIGFLTLLVFCSLHSMVDTMLDNYLWFMYVFLFIGYYKKYLSQNRIPKSVLLLSGVFVYLLLVMVASLPQETGYPLFDALGKVASQYLSDCKSVPNFVCSLSIFLFFTKLELGTNKVINVIASSAFAVYIIHQTPMFIPHLWFDIMHIDAWYTSPFLLPYVFLCVAALYASCMVIDAARKKWIEPIWIRSRIFRFAEQKMQGLYTAL